MAPPFKNSDPVVDLSPMACVSTSLLRTLVFFLLLLPGLSSARAQTISYCGDYFRDVWNVRLDMSDRAHGVLDDIPDFQLGTVGPLSYSGGVLSFRTTESSPRVTLLSSMVEGSIPVGTRYGELAPIDTSVYRHFHVRMYSSIAGFAQLIWHFSHNHYATVAFPIVQGWGTYHLDLATATPGSPSNGSPLAWTSGQVTGLTFLPINVRDVDVKLDWIQLTRGDCGSFTETFSGGSGLRRVVLDSNSSISDGYDAATTPTSGASHSFERHALFPGSRTMYGFSSSDWSLGKYARAFSMDNETDIHTWGRNQISGLAFSGGRLSGTSTGSAPYFHIGIPSGELINVSTYHYFTMGIEYNLMGAASEPGLILLVRGNGTYFAINFTASPGYNLINLDLAAFGGDIQHLRIQPLSSSGKSFSLDFVHLKSDGYATAQESGTITPLGTLTVQDLSLKVVQPDERGGSDFAQTVLGKTWNMDSTNTFTQIVNVASAKYFPHASLTDPLGGVHQGSFFRAENLEGNGDPIQYLALRDHEIDPSRFVNFCVKGWNRNETGAYNSVGRLIWADPRFPLGSQEAVRDGDDIIYARGNAEYCLDLRLLTYAQTEPPRSINPWTDIGAAGGTVNFFRFDTNENREAGYFSVLDYASLRTDHEANSRYAIVVDADLTKAVNLSFNSSASAIGATPITTLVAGRSSNTYLWDTSSVAEGSYYVIATLSHNGNTLNRVSRGRVQVSRSRAQDTTPPVLECERPFDGYSFDGSLEVAGYALDETRIASLELFTSSDNSTYDFFDTVSRTNFHLGAKNSYPNHADANAPGFQTFFDSSGLPTGTLYVRLVATDTGGNQTSCTRTVVRSPGGTTPALIYPAPDNSSIDAPIHQPSLTVRLSARISKAEASFSVSGCDRRSTLVGATSRARLASAPTTIGTLLSRGKASRLPSLRGASSKLVLRADCGTNRSRVVTLDTRRIRAKSKATLQGVLTKIRRNFRDVSPPA